MIPADGVSGGAGEGDAILVRGIRFEANHGAYPAERRQKRTFLVDVELRAPLGRPTATDRLRDTVNYEGICSTVVRVGTERTYHLLEALCGALVAALGERFPQAFIACEVRKPSPPCEGNPEEAAVRMWRGPRRAEGG